MRRRARLLVLVAGLLAGCASTAPVEPRARTCDRILYTSFHTYSFEIEALDLSSDGSVTRLSEGRVWSGVLAPGAFERLYSELEERGLFAMDARYVTPRTHQRSVKLGVWRDGEEQPFVVEAYGRVAPEELQRIHLAIRTAALEVLGPASESDGRDAWDLLWLLDPTVAR